MLRARSYVRRYPVKGPVLLVLGLAAGACTSSSAPQSAGDLVAVIGGEANSIAIVAAADSRVVARAGPTQPGKDAAAIVPDGKRFDVVDVGRAGRNLLTIRTQDFQVSSRVALNSPVAPHAFDGVYIGGDALAFSPDDKALLVGNAYRNDTAPPIDGEYVAALDAYATHVVAVVGPLQVREGLGLTALPPGPAAPNGAILGIGSRSRSGVGGVNTVDRLWVIDPTTLTIVDSLQPEPDPAAGADALLRQVVASPDGRHAYVVSDGGVIYACDLVQNRVVATAPAYGTGQLAIAPDGQTLYLTDHGDYIDTPGSGQVYVYGADLQSHPAIDLRPTFVGSIPATHGVVVSPSDSVLYVATGTASRGPLYGSQRLQVLVIDLTGRTPIRKIPVGDWGTAILLVVSR